MNKLLLINAVKESPLQKLKIACLLQLKKLCHLSICSLSKSRHAFFFYPNPFTFNVPQMERCMRHELRGFQELDEKKSLIAVSNASL